MKETILNDLKTAMKERNKEVLSVVRMVKGAMQLEEINLKRELTDEEIISVLVKQVKTRNESIVEFKKAGREELIEKTQNEIDILQKYLPAQLSEGEVLMKINEVIDQMHPTSMADMGKLMGALSCLKGKADMGFVSRIIKEKISKL